MIADRRIPVRLFAMALLSLSLSGPVRSAEPAITTAEDKAREDEARNRSRSTAEENAAIVRLSAQYMSLLDADDYEGAYAMVAKGFPEAPDFEAWRAFNDDPRTKRNGVAFRLPSRVSWVDVTTSPPVAGRYATYEYITVYTALTPTIETLSWYHDPTTGRYLLMSFEREALAKGRSHLYTLVTASREALLKTQGARLRQSREWDVIQWQGTPAQWAFTRKDTGRPSAMVLLVRLDDAPDRLQAYFTLCNDGYLECRALNDTVQKTDFDAVIAGLQEAEAPDSSEPAQESASRPDTTH